MDYLYRCGKGHERTVNHSMADCERLPHLPCVVCGEKSYRVPLGGGPMRWNWPPNLRGHHDTPPAITHYLDTYDQRVDATNEKYKDRKE